MKLTVMLPTDTHRIPITSITAVLLPSVTYLLTLPRRKGVTDISHDKGGDGPRRGGLGPTHERDNPTQAVKAMSLIKKGTGLILAEGTGPSI
jgi:hypothetical protein